MPKHEREVGDNIRINRIVNALVAELPVVGFTPEEVAAICAKAKRTEKSRL